MKVLTLFLNTALCLLALTSPGLTVATPSYDIVYFDLPESLEPNPIPNPTAALAALPGYPNNQNQLTLAGVVYKPDPQTHGSGPYPTIIVLHGSGGLWSFDDISNGPANQFKEWAQVLCDRGYLCLLPDSFNPRGIAGNFGGRRPHHNPATDDALCSPNYERPKDVVAALTYLTTRSDVDENNIGLLAFSHGAQTTLNVLLDPSIDISPYTVNYIDLVQVLVDNQPTWVEKSVPLQVPDPIRIPNHLPFPKVYACYYPGCGHYGYHGQASSIVASRYMPDRRCSVIMFHGTEDYLLDVNDTNVTPMTGNLFPITFVESSQLHANAENIENPFRHHLIFDHANHSFDNATIENMADWNTANEDEDEKAKRLARDETLKWFAYRLKPAEPNLQTDPQDNEVIDVTWYGQDSLTYQLMKTTDLSIWSNVGPVVIGANTPLNHQLNPIGPAPAFFKLRYAPLPPPSADPDNTGFFRAYSDFSY
ncbi:MAG: hypothetical protein AAGD22_10485 [Verrucomicrobiota bacterium]